MTVFELLEILGVDTDSCDEEMLNREVEIQYQPSYPLKSGVVNVCLDNVNGTVILAASDSTEYGSRAAWEEESIDS